MTLDHPVLHELGELRDGRGERLVEGAQGERPLDVALVDHAVAEEARDDLAAEDVVGRDAAALHGREAARLHRGVVLGVVLRVLEVHVVDRADRRDAHPVEVAPGVRRVALEVARERPVLLRLHDLVVGEREVVHPDVDVPGVHEALDARDEDRELLGALGEVRGEDALRALEPRARARRSTSRRGRDAAR